MAQAATVGGVGVLAEFSDQLAAAVETAGAAVARVEARRGNAASGIVWSAQGHVLAADHTIERDEDITVSFGDGRSTPATLVARDPGSDVALLKVEAADLTPAERALDDASSTKVGNVVLAIGRPGPAGVNASFGIVSALGGSWRTARGGQLDAFVRTDAMLYPGFSGGPLVDATGRVVAFNSWTLSQGGGLAIPIGLVARIAEQLAQGGVKRAYLGIGTQAVRLPSAVRVSLDTEQETGLMLITVEPDGPAEQGGLLIGDVLVAMNGTELRDAEDLLGLLSGGSAGTSASLKLIRGGELRDTTMTLGERA